MGCAKTKFARVRGPWRGHVAIVPRDALVFAGGKFMSDWLWFGGFFVVYVVLMRWVLPRLGVPT